MNILDRLGRSLVGLFSRSGEKVFLFFKTLALIHRIRFRKKQIVDQMVFCGIDTIPVAIVVAAFSGMVIALQSGKELMRFQLQAQTGIIVAASMLREMGPVMTAVIVAGRVGSAMTAELGTMQVSEEIDALKVMDIDPVDYLVVPRFWGLILMLPLLTVFSDIVGLIGGSIVSNYKIGVSFHRFFDSAWSFLEVGDLYTGLLKSVVFAATIATIACAEGFSARNGSKGVGLATTRTVVLSFLFILVFDYFITYFFYGG